MIYIDHRHSKDTLAFPPISESSNPIVRSDGRSFRLVSAERLVCYPAEKPTGKSGMSSIGFWYCLKQNDELTESVVVILRSPPKHPVDIIQQVQIVSDKLAERLFKA